MSSRLTRGAVAGTTVALGLSFLGQSAVFAASPDRATVGQSPGWTSSSAAVGHTAGATTLHMSAVLNLRDAAGAEALAAAVSDPANAAYRQFVSPAQWRARFAPTAAQVASVSRFLSDSGFTVTDVPANGRYVAFDGTAAQAEKAFGTSLQDYTKKGGRYSAPAAPVSVPGPLGSLVAGISGLDTSEFSTPAHIDGATDAGAAAAATAGSTAAPALPPPGGVFRNARPCSAYYGEKKATGVPQVLEEPLTYAPCGYVPSQVRGAYGIDTALAARHDGRGATVAIIDAYASPTIFDDAATYAQRNDPAHPLAHEQFSQLKPNYFRKFAECGPAGWYGEETLDVEAAHATAPGADILYVGAKSCFNNDLTAAVNAVVDGGLADVISNSYGNAGESFDRAEHQSYLQAAAQGISVLFSSGDSGDEKDNTGVRQADSPASDPFVTAVGGTSLAVGKNDQYLFEQGWGTGKSTLVNGAWDPLPPAHLYGGGGGISRLFSQPAYQQGVVPDGIATQYGSPPRRAVPDVAMVGDPNTGFLVGQSQTFPDGSVRYSEYRIGGTSLSSPLFAGVVAVADQIAGGSLGFLNPALYRLAGTDAYRDVNHGRQVTTGVVRVDFVNRVNAADGTVTSLRTLNQTQSIYTRKGWDDVTGNGSPNGVAFLSALAR